MLNIEAKIPELYEELTEQTYEDFLKSFRFWQSIPRAIDQENDSFDWNRLVWMSNIEAQEPVNEFLSEIRSARDAMLNDHQYDDALKFMLTAYGRATDEFHPDQQIMAQVHSLRALGNVYLHQILEGVRGNITLTDNQKTLSVFNMCVCYMQSDLLNFNITPLTAALLYSFLNKSPQEEIRAGLVRVYTGQKPEDMKTYHGQDLNEILRFAPEIQSFNSSADF